MQRLKIAQQIIIVLFFAVLIPFVTVGVIISNVSQQTVRRELNYTAVGIARFVGDNIKSYNELVKPVDKELAKSIIKEKYKGENREIFILDEDDKLIASNVKSEEDFSKVSKTLPRYRKVGEPILFNKFKNQPSAYYRLEKPDWTVVVNTTEKITNDTINLARFRIILSLAIAALSIITIVGIYTFYLYINIRQLFKGIIAISKGSYERKIHLLKSAFTPHEVVFLAKEFNYMAKKINQSYKDLSEKNAELERLNEFRSSLVNAISHEFRTPLTSIVGYTSRLLRHDIKIDDETKTKSLKVIKQQAQRLSRMVEDLLVVPEIESFSIKLNNVDVDLGELVENSVLYASANSDIFDIEIEKNVNHPIADNDRLEQVLINLCDNAVKYNLNGEKIKVCVKNVDDKPVFSIKNRAHKISEEMREKIFDKFIRTDSEMTRTTRGTGLGLYIVKGLCAAMDIKIDLNCTDDYFEIILTFNNYA